MKKNTKKKMEPMVTHTRAQTHQTTPQSNMGTQCSGISLSVPHKWIFGR